MLTEEKEEGRNVESEIAPENGSSLFDSPDAMFSFRLRSLGEMLQKIDTL
jgi:hypothetical protein